MGKETKDREIFGPLTLPSGVEIKFREPRGIDRVNVIKNLKMGMDGASGDLILVDTYVALQCVTEYDGRSEIGFYTKLVDQMSQEDMDFYRFVFDEMFGMTEEKKKDAKEAARFLRSKLISTDSSS